MISLLDFITALVDGLLLHMPYDFLEEMREFLFPINNYEIREKKF